MLATHNQYPVAFGLDKPHVRRILLASLLSIVVHAIAWQWIWHPAAHNISLSLPRPLEVVFATPASIQPHIPTSQPVQKIAHTTSVTTSRPALPTLALPLTNTQAPVAAYAVAVPAPAKPDISVPTAEPSSTAPVFNAAYLQNPQPPYPLSAKRRGIEGKVLLRAEVGSDGASIRVEVKKSSGWEMLDQAARQAVQNWRFVPARKGEQAVTAWVEIPISFRLDNDQPKQIAAAE